MASGVFWFVGAFIILFYDCDFLWWESYTVFYAIVGGNGDYGSQSGSTNLSLNPIASHADWWLGTSKLALPMRGCIFCDCDYLYWYDSSICYAFVDGSCIVDSVCGAFCIGPHGTAVYASWDIGGFSIETPCEVTMREISLQ